MQIETEKDLKSVGIIRQTDIHNYTNHHTHLSPLKNDGTLFVFNGWYLDSIYVNIQSNEGVVFRLIVHKEDKPLTDLHKVFNNMYNPKYYERYYFIQEEMYSQRLKDCINFLESLPKEISTEKESLLWSRLYSVVNKSKLIEYYEEYIENREYLTEMELKMLEKIFFMKLKLIIST